jgi:hypothetical protein
MITGAITAGASRKGNLECKSTRYSLRGPNRATLRKRACDERSHLSPGSCEARKVSSRTSRRSPRMART